MIARLIHSLISVANGADDRLLDELLAPDFTRKGDHLSESASGIAAVRALIRKMRLDMPDLEVVIVDELYDGSRGAIRWRMAGTDSGPGDFPPTHKYAEATGMSFFEVEGGKLAREWTLVDGVGLLAQLGFKIEPPGT